ncbi:MAG: MarR family transcriptional regulator [Candidatus Marinimicrobia bacterium]|nr:MarR family transcriptional regulator [FCB group bacterium]MBL7024138.1 MarR family transcriptional regulator [Candidatus Neomarinimicrobiota bacterium]
MSTHYQGNPREKLVLDTFIKFSRANNTLNQFMRHNVEQQGLTISQFGVLEVLKHIGPLSVKEIGQKLLMTTSNLVTVIDNLVKQELVKRVPCDHDRRSIIIHLTQKGSGFIEPVFRNHLDELLNCFSVIDDQQLITLGSLSKELGLKQKEKHNEKS